MFQVFAKAKDVSAKIYFERLERGVYTEQWCSGLCWCLPVCPNLALTLAELTSPVCDGE